MLACGLAMAGCGRGGSFPARSSAPVTGSAEIDPGYRAPPELSAAQRAADGVVTLSGRAPASSRVRLASPMGAVVETAADGSGAWRAVLGPVSEPALYGLSAEAEGRKVQAEGYVAVLPGPPGVALLRAGAGAQPLEPLGSALRITAVDFDGDGAAVVSGQARPGSALRVLVDGAGPVNGAAGGEGRFSLTLPNPLAPGVRRIQVLSPTGSAATQVRVAPAKAFFDVPYRAAREGSGWRIDWITPGGGAQSTVLLTGADERR